MSAAGFPFSLPRVPKKGGRARLGTSGSLLWCRLYLRQWLSIFGGFMGIQLQYFDELWPSGWRWSLITQNDNSKPCEEIWSWIMNYTGVWCMDLSCSTMVSGAPPKHREISGSSWVANIKPQLVTGDCSKHLMLSDLQWKWHGIIPQ
jgi:hypothetical protein